MSPWTANFLLLAIFNGDFLSKIGSWCSQNKTVVLLKIHIRSLWPYLHQHDAEEQDDEREPLHHAEPLLEQVVREDRSGENFQLVSDLVRSSGEVWQGTVEEVVLYNVQKTGDEELACLRPVVHDIVLHDVDCTDKVAACGYKSATDGVEHVRN